MKEIFDKAMQSYIADPGKSVPKLLKYAEVLRGKKVVKRFNGSVAVGRLYGRSEYGFTRKKYQSVFDGWKG